MKKLLLIFFVFNCSISLIFAQYISEVIEYKPAPGQLINSSPWGIPESANSIIGGINGTMSLGAFGGYVIFKFDAPVKNHPDNPFGIDFTIFGNPADDWSEPAAVFVMKDENENGIADDSWYELAGSDYFFSSTLKNYEITYSNPGGETAIEIPWSDNLGLTGFVQTNSFHTQTYYPINSSFPNIDNNNYSLTGTKIKDVVDVSNPATVKSYKRAFGYADNQIRGSEPYTIPDNPYTYAKENSGGDAFDISWAVDNDGEYMSLDEVHFIKVQSCVNANASWLGEISPEITGAIDVTPDNSITGNEEIIVIKDLPPIIYSDTYQLEVFVFSKGKLRADKELTWSINLNGASINENDLLSFNESGDLSITATLLENSEISASASAKIDLDASRDNKKTSDSKYIYPNPTSNYIQVSGLDNVNITVCNSIGSVLAHFNNVSEKERISLKDFSNGIYILRIFDGSSIRTYKVIKE